MLASEVVIVYLANLMWAEQGEDLFNGMTGCGLVVRNRILAGWDNQDWVTNIQKHHTYSAHPLDMPKMWQLGDPVRNDKFRRCLGLATNIYEGREKDITAGATRYCDMRNVSEDFANKIIRPTITHPDGSVTQVHPRVSQIGQRSYFK